MGGEQRRLNWWRQWENVLLLVCALGWSLCIVYLGTHYATSTVAGEPGCCALVRTHLIAGKRVPKWVDTHIFWLAEQVDPFR
jgi:hypothetical protein